MSNSEKVAILLIEPAKPRRIRVRIKGMSPLMVDPIPPETVKAMITGVKQQVQKDRPLEDICKDKLSHLRDPTSGRIALKRGMLAGALMNAGRNVPYRGKSNISTAETSFLHSIMKFEDPSLLLFDDEGKEPKWEVNTDVGNGQTSKNAIVRPRFETWNFDLTFQYDDGLANESTMRKLFMLAGKEIGLGCFRVGRKGECGQFMIVKWEDITPDYWPQAKASTGPAASTKKTRGRAAQVAQDEVSAESDGQNVNGNGQLAGAGSHSQD